MNRRQAHFLLGLIAASMLIIAGCGNQSDAPTTVSTASPAASPEAKTGSAQPWFVKEVVDVKLVKDQEGEKVVQGSILGTGLRQGNMVIINKGSTLGTVFGNPTWITFSVPLSTLGTQNSFTLQVVDPATKEESQTFTVNFKR